MKFLVNKLDCSKFLPTYAYTTTIRPTTTTEFQWNLAKNSEENSESEENRDFFGSSSWEKSSEENQPLPTLKPFEPVRVKVERKRKQSS